MDWTQVATIIGVNIALIASMATLIVWTVNKLDVDMKSIGDRVDKLADRVDKLGIRLDGHATRIDQLYQMFIQLLKDRK